MNVNTVGRTATIPTSRGLKKTKVPSLVPYNGNHTQHFYLFYYTLSAENIHMGRGNHSLARGLACSRITASGEKRKLIAS